VSFRNTRRVLLQRHRCPGCNLGGAQLAGACGQHRPCPMHAMTSMAALDAGTGYGYGAGVRIDSPLGPVRLEYAWNARRQRRFHVALGYD